MEIFRNPSSFALLAGIVLIVGGTVLYFILKNWSADEDDKRYRFIGIAFIIAGVFGLILGLFVVV